MTFQLRKSRRDPGSPICSNCCTVTYKQRWTLSFGHGQFRRFKTQRILKPGDRWLCQAGHDRNEYEKVASERNSVIEDNENAQETVVQRAKLVCSDYDSETGKDQFTNTKRVHNLTKKCFISESVVEELSEEDHAWCPDIMTPKKKPYRLVDDWNTDWTPGRFDNADE